MTNELVIGQALTTSAMIDETEVKLERLKKNLQSLLSSLSREEFHRFTTILWERTKDE